MARRDASAVNGAGKQAIVSKLLLVPGSSPTAPKAFAGNSFMLMLHRHLWYDLLVRGLYWMVLLGCGADHHTGTDGALSDSASVHCVTDPALEFCDDFEAAAQQIDPYGFLSFPSDPAITTAIIGGVPGSALQIDESVSSSVNAFGITPTFPFDGTSSELVFRLDANMAFYSIHIFTISFDSGYIEIIPYTQMRLMGILGNEEIYTGGTVPYPFFNEWITFELHMAFDPNNVTFSLWMAPQGSELVSIFGDMTSPNPLPPTSVKASIGVPVDNSVGHSVVAFDNITLDVR